MSLPGALSVGLQVCSLQAEGTRRRPGGCLQLLSGTVLSDCLFTVVVWFVSQVLLSKGGLQCHDTRMSKRIGAYAYYKHILCVYIYIEIYIYT